MNTVHFSLRGLGGKVKALLLNAFPILLGFDPLRFSTDSLESWGSLLLGGIMMAGVCIFLLVLWTARKDNTGPGGGLFLLLFLITAGLNLFTEYGLTSLSSDDPRYLLPLYSCLPVFLGVLFLRVWSRSRSLVLLLALPFLFFHLLGNVKHPAYVFFNGWTLFDSVKLRDYRDTRDRDQALQAYLLDKGLTRLYAREHPGKKITLLSGEKIIVAEPYQENYLPYAWAVDGAPRMETSAPAGVSNSDRAPGLSWTWAGKPLFPGFPGYRTTTGKYLQVMGCRFRRTARTGAR
jgi:hypothetical protein